MRGIVRPTRAKTPSIPARALGAPQTTCTRSLPVSTMHTLRRSASGCGSAEITRATVNSFRSFARSSMASTSRPSITKVRTISSRLALLSR